MYGIQITGLVIHLNKTNKSLFFCGCGEKIRCQNVNT